MLLGQKPKLCGSGANSGWKQSSKPVEARPRDLGKELRIQKGPKKTARKTAKESREELLKVMELFVMQQDKVWSF